MQSFLSPFPEGLSKFFNSKQFSDVTLVTSEGTRLHAHRLVLAACSDRLEKLLSEGDAGTTVEVPCMDVEPEALENLVRFLYTSSCSFTIDNVMPIMYAARKYGISRLEALAGAYAQSQLTMDTCCTFILRADDVGCERLKAQALAVAAERLGAISRTDAFLNLSNGELKHILKNPELLSCPEVELFKAVCSWVLADVQRLKYLEEILSTINFPKLTARELKSVQDLLCMKYQEAMQRQETPTTPQSTAQSTGAPQAHPPATTGAPETAQVSASLPQSAPVVNQASTVRHGHSSVPLLPAQISTPCEVQQPNVTLPPAGSLPVVQPQETALNQQVQEIFMSKIVQGTNVSVPLSVGSSAVAQLQTLIGGAQKKVEGEQVSQNSDSKRMDCSDVASGTDETDQHRAEGNGDAQRSETTASRVRSAALSGSRGSRCVCQVEGCNNTLEGLRDYHVRYKICDHHLKVGSIIKDGRTQRFCQQCGRFHDLSQFDGNKRSCRARLMRHNARRRKRCKMEHESDRNPVVSAGQPLICVLPSTPALTTHGLKYEIAHHAPPQLPFPPPAATSFTQQGLKHDISGHSQPAPIPFASNWTEQVPVQFSMTYSNASPVPIPQNIGSLGVGQVPTLQAQLSGGVYEGVQDSAVGNGSQPSTVGPGEVSAAVISVPLPLFTSSTGCETSGGSKVPVSGQVVSGHSTITGIPQDDGLKAEVN